MWIGLYDSQSGERARPSQWGGFLVEDEMVLLGKVWVAAAEQSN